MRLLIMKETEVTTIGSFAYSARVIFNLNLLSVKPSSSLKPSYCRDQSANVSASANRNMDKIGVK